MSRNELARLLKLQVHLKEKERCNFLDSVGGNVQIKGLLLDLKPHEV